MNIIDNWLSSTFQDFEWLLRIFISALLGFFIGLNRTHKHKPAGVKTYMYVATASTLITIVSIQSVLLYAGVREHTMMDPMRLAAQIVTGLGFIGAGVILKDGARVIGLTSAAMIFYAGGIGIAIGAGLYTFVLFSFMVTNLFVWVGEWIEKRQTKKTNTPSSTLLEISE
ncbi:MgtC/SapB family protein [Paenibacillus mendelii]|uniref:MgtC/SapB family protein n=1 Tax=Paenibacillus mendelii TaxID=206163 RepID=A0ABV6JK08_9BACL|nr:MgtC/SapB family protein [Paenibacillus mendelii]MCQ6559186.1 MgtC/SapB family protein [Paenibacillus mendelii]